MRDHRKLEIFRLSDELAVDIYRETSQFPSSERYGLRTQLRRSAVSIPVNIVEGCGRRSDVEFDRFLDISLGSARELVYLVDLSHRLGFLPDTTARELARKSNHVCSSIVRFVYSRLSFRQ